MQIDLQTLWYLTIGTLLVSTSLLLWERQAHPARARGLAVLAGLALLLLAISALNGSTNLNRADFGANPRNRL